MLKSLIGKYIDKRTRPLRDELVLLTEEVDHLRSRLDLGDAAFARFQAERRSPEYLSVFESKAPLVSALIATYNRADLLCARALRSLIEQDYENLEIIVVGDACRDHTEEAVAKLGDPRIQFINRPVRGDYPENPHLRWMVAGTDPVNQALELAKGDFITHLDDDDEHDVRRISQLLAFAQENRADLVWHPFDFEDGRGKWTRNEAAGFKRGQVTTSSVFYHRWFKQIPWDPHAYLNLEPGDWNRFRKFKFLGAELKRFPQALLRHYRERTNR